MATISNTDRDSIHVPWNRTVQLPGHTNWPLAFAWHHVFPCSRFCNLWNAILSSFRTTRLPEGALAVRQFLGLCGHPSPQIERWMNPLRANAPGQNWEQLKRGVIYPPWNIVEGPHTTIRDDDPGDVNLDRFVAGLTPGDRLRMTAVETFYQRVSPVRIQDEMPVQDLRIVAGAATLARSIMQRNTEPIRFREQMWERTSARCWRKRRA